MEHAPEKKFPADSKNYKLYEEVGEGVSATVFRALCIPLNEIVAVKVLDLEKCNNDLDGIRQEVQTMSLINHPNLLRAHCSFTSGHNLWVVMPYMAGGSCLHIMKSSYPEGFEEAVIATLLHEVLKALVYLHANGHIHRDVKAGNILVDNNGAVKLADFGVSACMFDTGDRQRSRNTFVGTPCWMAPEVMQQLHGYDFKADIWSFGITALELAHGHAPFSKYPPMKVLLMTLQNAPPGLDYERDKRFSKSFKELVAACLVKDPKKRPSSEKLLKHHFFKRARATNYLSRTILDGLAPLGDRFRTLKAKEAALLVQNKALYEDKEQLSQQEYIRGISAWNFNLDDLKSQAAMIQDFDTMSNAENSDLSEKRKDHHDEVGPAERSSSEIVEQSNSAHHGEEDFVDLHDLESSLASFPIKPLQALKDCFDVIEDDAKGSSPGSKGTRSDTEEQLLAESPPRFMDQETARKDSDHVRSAFLSHHGSIDHRKFLSGPVQMDSPKKNTNEGDRDYQQVKYQQERNYSGQLLFRQKKDTNNFSSVEDKSEGGIVQRKGRFKVTSADLSPKGPANSSFGTVHSSSSNLTAPNPIVATVLPTLQCVLQQNTMQREEVIRMINFLEQISGKNVEPAELSINELMQTSPASTKERELRSLVTHLEQSIDSIIEELERQKAKNAELEKQVNSLTNKGNAVRKGE